MQPEIQVFSQPIHMVTKIAQNRQLSFSSITKQLTNSYGEGAEVQPSIGIPVKKIAQQLPTHQDYNYYWLLLLITTIIGRLFTTEKKVFFKII